MIMIPVEALLTREIFQPETLGKTEDITTDAAAEDEEATTVPVGKTEQKPADYSELKAGAVVVSMESEDPYGDFRASMAEMVVAHGLRDWEGLEELLAWYLKLNAKGVHGVIVGAFVDLLVSLATPPSPSLPSQSPSSSCITFEDYSWATFDDEEKC
uniref:Transcription repressor n=2 Tax=Aegilops tauschii TaxID=37682 RepID=A0A453BY93_AEGTS